MRQTNTSLLSFHRHLDLLSEICSHYNCTGPGSNAGDERTMTTTGGIITSRSWKRESDDERFAWDTATTARWEASERDIFGKLGGIFSFFPASTSGARKFRTDQNWQFSSRSWSTACTPPSRCEVRGRRGQGAALSRYIHLPCSS